MTHDIRFRNPSTFILAGASQSGKTTFVLNLLRQAKDLFRDPRCLQNVIYYYKEWQDVYAKFADEHIVFDWVNEVPTASSMREKTLAFKQDGGSIVVIDDFAQELTRDIVTIFSVLAHHTNSVVILLQQNIFSKNPVFREISLNATYIIVFKNPRDSSQITHFAKQFAPGNFKWIVDAYRTCTKKPYTYLLFDSHQSTPDILRLRSDVFDESVSVWTEKSAKP